MQNNCLSAKCLCLVAKIPLCIFILFYLFFFLFFNTTPAHVGSGRLGHVRSVAYNCFASTTASESSTYWDPSPLWVPAKHPNTTQKPTGKQLYISTPHSRRQETTSIHKNLMKCYVQMYIYISFLFSTGVKLFDFFLILLLLFWRHDITNKKESSKTTSLSNKEAHNMQGNTSVTTYE